MILGRVRPTEQDFLLCLTNGGHIMKAIFNVLHGGGRVTERRLIIFFLKTTFMKNSVAYCRKPLFCEAKYITSSFVVNIALCLHIYHSI